MAAMKEIPGVENVSFSANRRMVGELLPIESVFIRGGPFAADGAAPRALVKHVSNEFFATMGIPILEGRSFAPDDDQTSFVVDDAFARRYLQGQPQLGAEVRWGSPTGPWKRVVGIAGRAIYKGLEDRDGLPVLYVCSNQYQTSTFSLLLRTTRPAEIVIREARTKLQEIDPELYLVNPTSLEVPLGNLHLERQGTTLLTGVFAALALFVSAIGIYGILAYDVQQRRREFGIRAAIGANRLQVLTMVLQQGLWKTGLGLVLGLIGAFAVSQYLSSLLFDVSALDPVTYLAVVVGLSLVALTASLIPARRATKVDPAITLRAE
jgi:hypothetical protein